jgi:hypothetical protein
LRVCQADPSTPCPAPPPTAPPLHGCTHSTTILTTEDFALFDRDTLGESGCWTDNSSTTCDWPRVLGPGGAGCGYATDGGPHLRCVSGNVSITNRTRWGVVLLQTKDIIVVTTVTSGRRGLLSLLGSLGGAYQILCVCACVRLCRGCGVGGAYVLGGGGEVVRVLLKQGCDCVHREVGDSTPNCVGTSCWWTFFRPFPSPPSSFPLAYAPVTTRMCSGW